MPLILAQELDTLTVQEIEEWDRRAGDATSIFIDVIDKPNITLERWRRLQSLVHQRDELSKPYAVNADELNAKLRQVSPRRPPTTSDTASTPTTAGGDFTEVEVIDGVQRIAYRDHEKLKGMGGRQSREINPDPGPCSPFISDIEQRYHVSDHWYREAGRIEEEVKRWLDFRWHQFKVRESSKKFKIYTEAVCKHREEMGMDWVVELQLSRQTKLDEWREYYVYERRKRPALEKKLGRAKRELESAKEQVREAESNGSIGVSPTALSGRWGELVNYDEKISQAQKEVDKAHMRLKVARVEQSLSPTLRERLITQVKEDLESAQKRLNAEESNELEQLKKEVERMNAQEVLAHAQGTVNHANTRLEQLDTLLEWITEQFAEIATEYASSSWGSQYNRDLLEGWNGYYIYIHERVQRFQERDRTMLPRTGWEYDEAQQAREDRLYPQENVRPLKALLAWIEQEFPEIAAKHASFSHASQPNHDHGDETGLPCLKPSPNEPARKASRKNTRRKGESAKEQSPLRQVQASRVSKLARRGKSSNTHHEAWPPEGSVDDVGRIEVQGPPKVAVRRSERISWRTCEPAPPILGSTRPSKDSSQRFPDPTVRRSARICPLGLGLDIKPATPSTAAGRKSTRRAMVRTNAAYSGTPQGVSKTRRREATSKKRRIV